MTAVAITTATSRSEESRSAERPYAFLILTPHSSLLIPIPIPIPIPHSAFNIHHFRVGALSRGRQQPVLARWFYSKRNYICIW